MPIANLIIAVMLLTCGAYILLSRTSIVQEGVIVYEHYPNLVRRFYAVWYRFHRFKTYEAFAIFNTVLQGHSF